MQNMPATMKAQIDGIADAMGVDDRRFRCVWPEVFGARVKGGAVLVTVETKDTWQPVGDVAARLVKGATE
jgi:hypothetical protein